MRIERSEAIGRTFCSAGTMTTLFAALATNALATNAANAIATAVTTATAASALGEEQTRHA